MSTFKNITIRIPARLFEMGLTKDQVNYLVNRWLVISFFQQGKLDMAEAARILATDEADLAVMLAEPAVLHWEMASRLPPVPVELEQPENQLAILEEELAKTKTELLQTKRQLREVDKIKSEFIATISHELRTPLNSIIGFTKLLLNQKLGPLNEVQQTDLSVIYNNAKHLLGLVNDILDLSKIDAGKIRLEKEWVTVEEIVVGVMASTYILIEGKPIELKEEIEPHLPAVYVDRGRIRQVVLNIVSNAAKFTDAGSIILRIRKVTQADREFLHFSVKDTGIGIASEDMSKVFEAFRQIDSSVARRAEGTGLGMPISQRLVKLHGGELWVESVVGQGSTFSFTIPVQPSEAVADDDPTSADAE
jgi:signal transduction histidine kinase